MKIICLGTGTSQGIPVIGCQCEVCTSADPRDRRFRSSIHVESGGQHIQIDIGPDFRLQMLNNDLSKVDAILLTHEHNDHVAGIDDIRPVNFHYKNEIPIYGEERVLDQVKERFHYAFTEKKYPGAPDLQLISIAEEPFDIDGLPIIPIRVMHGGLPILGFRIGRMAYLTDVKSIPESEHEKLSGLDVLILSALRREPHFSHLTLDEAMEFAQRFSPGQTYLTHISHLMGRHEEVDKLLPAKVGLAFDGLTIEI